MRCDDDGHFAITNLVTIRLDDEKRLFPRVISLDRPLRLPAARVLGRNANLDDQARPTANSDELGLHAKRRPGRPFSNHR
jgi:hypothetical protein